MPSRARLAANMIGVEWNWELEVVSLGEFLYHVNAMRFDCLLALLHCVNAKKKDAAKG